MLQQKILSALLLTTVVTLSGCTFTKQEKYAAGGGVLGAAVGTGIAAAAEGNLATGALVGAGVGAIGGAILGSEDD